MPSREPVQPTPVAQPNPSASHPAGGPSSYTGASGLGGESMFVDGSRALATPSPLAAPPPQWAPPTERPSRVPKMIILAASFIVVLVSAGFGGWWYVGYRARLAATPVPTSTVSPGDMKTSLDTVDQKLHDADTATGQADDAMGDVQGDLSE